MALPEFDATKHHVGLGEDGAELGLIVAGAYRKSFKRDIADDLAGVHYGSDSLFNQPGVSSWSMDDFTGGGWQQVYGKDPAQFSYCQNMLPTSFDRSLRTVPPLVMRAATGSGGGVYTAPPLTMFNHQGWVVMVFPERLYRYHIQSGGAAEVFLTRYGSSVYGHACYDRRHGKIIATYVSPVTGGTGIAVIDPITGVAIESSGIEPGALSFSTATGINCDGDRLIVACADVVYTAQMGDGVFDAIGTDWQRIGRLPSAWIDSTWMAQQLFILCGGSDRQASLVAFDGVQLLPVTEFPYNFYGQSLCPYAGRIYCGGTGLDIAGGAGYAELHEVTGSTVRLVKTFAPEYQSGRYTAPSSIYSMVVHEGLLFFGDTGRGLIAYDVTTDSLYGAHQYEDGRYNESRYASAMISARNHIWAYVPHPAASGDNALYAGATAGDAPPYAGYSATFYSSEFGPELDRMKKWGKMRLLTRGDVGTPSLEYSVDAGTSYHAVGAIATEPAGVSVMRTYDLSSAPTSHSIRFRFVFPRGQTLASYTELVGFSTSFQLVDSDDLHANGTEKLGWSFAVAGVETIQLEDGTATGQKLGELRAQLWEMAQSRDTFSFIDTDGQVYDVKVATMNETQPVILPPVEFDDPLGVDDDSGREAFYAITLVEA